MTLALAARALSFTLRAAMARALSGHAPRQRPTAHPPHAPSPAWCRLDASRCRAPALLPSGAALTSPPIPLCRARPPPPRVACNPTAVASAAAAAPRQRSPTGGGGKPCPACRWAPRTLTVTAALLQAEAAVAAAAAPAKAAVEAAASARRGSPLTDDDDVDAGAPECRICRGGAKPRRPLFHPCRWAGSIKFIHEECLARWLAQYRSTDCECCHTPFVFYEPLCADHTPATLPVPELLTGAAQRAVAGGRRSGRAALVVTARLTTIPLGTCWAWRAIFMPPPLALPAVLAH